MFHRNNTILRNGTGLAVANASVTVYVNGTDTAGDYTNATKAPIYSANEAIVGNLIANSVILTATDGEYGYYVPDGIYDEVARYGSITEIETYIQMVDLFDANTDSEEARDQAVAAKDEAVAAAASATSSKNDAASSADDAATSAAAADESTTTAAAARGDALAAAVDAVTAKNEAADSASAALDAKEAAEAAAAGAGAGYDVQDLTDDHTADETTGEHFIRCSGDLTYTLPTAVGSVAKFHIKIVGAGVLTITPDGSETIEGDATLVLDSTADTDLVGTVVSIFSNGSNWEAF